MGTFAVPPGNPRETGMKLLVKFAFVVFALACALGAQAQAWPTGPVRLVVPFPPGGATDLIARLFAKELQDSIGQTVVVDNRGGAGGAIAAEMVARSPADGHTLLFGSNSVMASNVGLYKTLSYSPTADFTPIMRIGESALVLVVRSDSEIKTLNDFVRVAKEKPGKLSGGFGAASVQTAQGHLAAVADIKLLPVPYKSVSLSLTDLLGGVIDFAFADIGTATPPCQGGETACLGPGPDRQDSPEP